MRRVWVGTTVALALLLCPAAGWAVALRVIEPRLYPGEAVAGGGVAWGPGGDLWFATSQGRMARMTPAGVVSEFGHGITEGGASGPIAASANAVWFAEAQSGTGPQWLGRITSSAAVSQVSSEVSQIVSMVRGSGGTVWFDGPCAIAGCAGDDEFGRIDPDGSIQLFPDPSHVADALTLGDDGKLWFSATNGYPPSGGQLGRVSPDGAVSLVQLPRGVVPALSFVPMVRGPGDGVWFVSMVYSHRHPYGVFRFGYTTDRGRTTMLPSLPPPVVNAYPVASGPSGDMWFVQQRANPTTGATSPDDAAVLTLITPRGRVLAEAPGIYPLYGPATPGPGASLWFGSPQQAGVSPGLMEVEHSSDHEAQCRVPDELGHPLDVPLTGDTTVTQLAQLGCTYRATTRSARGNDGPFVITRENPRPKEVIPRHRRISLTLSPPRARYGRCLAPARAVEFTHSSSVVVFARSTPSGVLEYFGCQLGSGRILQLFTDEADSESSSTAELFSLGGDYVAFETIDFNHYAPFFSYTVREINLTSGVSTTTSVPQIDALAVSVDGFLAWSYHTFPSSGSPSTAAAGYLIGEDQSGQHTLDTTGPLDLTGVRFTGDTLHWNDNGVAREANLS